jgi:hypothetical protein
MTEIGAEADASSNPARMAARCGRQPLRSEGSCRILLDMQNASLPLLGILALATSCSAKTYSAADMCGGRLPHWQSPDPGIGELAILQAIIVTRTNAIQWNGRRITMATLDSYLKQERGLNPRPQMVLHVKDGASCETVGIVRSLMEKHLQCSTTHACGEGRGWRRWPGARAEDR